MLLKGHASIHHLRIRFSRVPHALYNQMFGINLSECICIWICTLAFEMGFGFKVSISSEIQREVYVSTVWTCDFRRTRSTINYLHRSFRSQKCTRAIVDRYAGVSKKKPNSTNGVAAVGIQFYHGMKWMPRTNTFAHSHSLGGCIMNLVPARQGKKLNL